MLARESRMADRERAALDLSRQATSTPDLSVGYMFQQRTGNPVMQGAQFTVNLPALHRERLRQEVSEGELRLQAATRVESRRRLEAANELSQAYAAAQTARQMATSTTGDPAAGRAGARFRAGLLHRGQRGLPLRPHQLHGDLRLRTRRPAPARRLRDRRGPHRGPHRRP
jgi:hypothetical protein